MSDDADDYTCIICMERFDLQSHDPLMLPCRHTFCKSCISGLQRRSLTFRCPTCRAYHPSNTDFPVNSHIRQLISTSAPPSGRRAVSKPSMDSFKDLSEDDLFDKMKNNYSLCQKYGGYEPQNKGIRMSVLASKLLLQMVECYNKVDAAVLNDLTILIDQYSAPEFGEASHMLQLKNLAIFIELTKRRAISEVEVCTSQIAVSESAADCFKNLLKDDLSDKMKNNYSLCQKYGGYEPQNKVIRMSVLASKLLLQMVECYNKVDAAVLNDLTILIDQYSPPELQEASHKLQLKNLAIFMEKTKRRAISETEEATAEIVKASVEAAPKKDEPRPFVSRSGQLKVEKEVPTASKEETAGMITASVKIVPKNDEPSGKSKEEEEVISVSKKLRDVFFDMSGFEEDGESGFGVGSGGRPDTSFSERTRDCVNCGQKGHQTRGCPKPNKEMSFPCFKCGQKGHRSADCTEPRKERRSPSEMKCYKCGRLKHKPSDCSEPQKERNYNCMHCGQSGHMPSECRGCFNCGQVGHKTRDCPKAKKERSSACFNCGQEGHRSSDCTEPRKERGLPVKCYNCGVPGHRSSDCPEPRKERNARKPASTYVMEDLKTEDLFADNTEKGEMFDRFFDQEVVLSKGGKRLNTVRAIETFDQMRLGKRMEENLARSNYSKLTPIQKYAMPLVMDSQDIMACSQTGSGKTAAFLLPIMFEMVEDDKLVSTSDGRCCPRVLILVPTRELAKQIYKEARKFSYGTKCMEEICYGGTNVSWLKSRMQQGVNVLMGTPGRICQCIDEGDISLSELHYLVFDEADRMLDMGFSKDINRITQNAECRPKEERQTLMFSATFPPIVQQLAEEFLRKDYVMIVVDKIGAANKCITQDIVMVEKREKKYKLLELLNADLSKYKPADGVEIFKKKTLVFANSKKLVDTLGAIISDLAIPCTTIHGDKDQKQRETALSDFRKGKTPVLIATGVAERGLDITGVDHVINYDMPKDIDEYVLRIGRTGRAGNTGRATSLFLGGDDDCLARDLVLLLSQAEQVVPEWLQNMQGCGGGGGDFGGSALASDDDGW